MLDAEGITKIVREGSMVRSIRIDSINVVIRRQRKGSKFYRGDTGKLACSVEGPSYGQRAKSFPEGKKGLNFPKIVDEIKLRILQEKERQVQITEKRATAAASKGHVSKLREKYSLPTYSSVLKPSVEDGSKVVLNLGKLTVTPEQADAFLALAKEVGVRL